MARGEHNVVISCNMKLNLDYLLDVLWEHLALLRVYTKKPGMIKQHFIFQSCNENIVAFLTALPLNDRFFLLKPCMSMLDLRSLQQADLVSIGLDNAP